MFAAVDLGSNSFRLHVGEPTGDGGEIRILRSARDPVRLAAGLDPSGRLNDAAIGIGVRSLQGFAAILAEYRLDAVRVVGTNTLRLATNAASVLKQFEAAIGRPIEIISGEEEGRLIYMGVARALARPNEARLVIDIGGGSTEVIAGHGDSIVQVESFSIGTQPQAGRWFGDGRITRAAFSAAVTEARAVFEDAAPNYHGYTGGPAYGSSGTMRAIADTIAKSGIGDGMLSLPSLYALRELLIGFGHVDAVALAGLKRERVVAVVGGASVLIGAMEEFGVTRLTAINAGLRLGVLSDLELRSKHQDRRALAIGDCMRRFGVDSARARRAADIARHFYLQLESVDASCLDYLSWSCLLHEVGLAVSHTGAHKHGAYIVEHADLPGFTTREQRLMATLVLGHKGNLRKVRESLSEPAFARMVLAMRLAVACMHARVDEELDDVKLAMGSRIELTVEVDWLERHPTLSAWLERERAAWEELGRKFVLRGV
ncbi:MAG: Ppx/GppA phosphatase family protein [Pseudomonadota bacterium]